MRTFEIIDEFDHFCSRIDFKKSALDARAIRFMNEFNRFAVKDKLMLNFALEKLNISEEDLLNEMKILEKI